MMCSLQNYHLLGKHLWLSNRPLLPPRLQQVALNESLSLRERTLALRAALKASSAEAGVRALNAALQAHQAPTLAPVAQPIRWMPRSKTPGTA